MDHEKVANSNIDEIVKSLQDLYAAAKFSSALARTSLRHVHLEGVREDRIAWFHRATDAVTAEDLGGYDFNQP